MRRWLPGHLLVFQCFTDGYDKLCYAMLSSTRDSTRPYSKNVKFKVFKVRGCSGNGEPGFIAAG